MRHFCQLIRNCALAASRLGARPLVVMPSMGLTYSVIDQNHRSSGLLFRSSLEAPHVAAILDDHVVEPIPVGWR